MEEEIFGKQMARVNDIHATLEDYTGKRLHIRANLGRSKVLEREGTLTQAHNALFIVEVDEKRGRKARQSYQYVDVLTGMVELSNPETQEPLFPDLIEEEFQIQPKLSACAQHKEKAHAKLNLCLAVKHPPINGYHELDSIFQEIDFFDVLDFKIAASCTHAGHGDIFANGAQTATTKAGTRIVLKCSKLDIAIEDNLIFQAFDALEQAHKVAICAQSEELLIHVIKHIPAGGGLGGGSSDAAACIRAFSKFANIDVCCEKNIEVAKMLGADVAFFLHGGTAFMKGRGDILEERLPRFPLAIVLMGSNAKCNTGEVYNAFDKNPSVAPSVQDLADALISYNKAEGSLAKTIAASFLAQRCANNLQPAAFETLPPLRQRIDKALENKTVLNALVTGSGSTSYAICANMQLAQEFARDAASFCDWVKVTKAIQCTYCLV